MASTKKNQAGIKQSALLKWVRPGNHCSQRLKMLFQIPYISKSSGGACPWTPLAARAFGTPDCPPPPPQ